MLDQQKARRDKVMLLQLAQVFNLLFLIQRICQIKKGPLEMSTQGIPKNR